MRRTIGLILLGALLVAAVAVALFWDQLPWRTTPGGGEILTPEVLADYLPADAAGVFRLHVRQLREAPAARALLPSLRQLAFRSQIEVGWLRCARIDLAAIDDLRIVLPAKDPGGALWVARGPIHPGEFEVGPKCFQERRTQGRQLWEYRAPDKRLWQLYAAGDLLVAAPPHRMAELLTPSLHVPAASHPEPPVAPLLAKVDRTQAMWLAMSLEALGHISRPENRSLDLIVGPILRHAQTVTGGLAAGKDLRGEFVFTTADEESARALEVGLRSVLLLAEGAGGLVDRDFQPVVHLLGKGGIQRDGTTVTLRFASAED
jgi:hypothetical protein